jgi:transcriptional regulator with XRE-family HTH domain
MQNTVGFRIKAVREWFKLSQAELAEELNETQSSISKIELGRKWPSVQTIILLCQKRNVDPRWLLLEHGADMFAVSEPEVAQLRKEVDTINEMLGISISESSSSALSSVMKKLNKVTEKYGKIQKTRKA